MVQHFQVAYHISFAGSSGHLVEGDLVAGVSVVVRLAVGVVHAKGLGEVDLDRLEIVAQEVAS